jgi:UDP-N-acetyl-D-mannosaminuronate dehydrogenase
MYLAWQAKTQLGKRFRFAELADEVNNERPVYVAARTQQMLERTGQDIAGAKVLVLGVAYKPGVGDTRESPAVSVVKALTDLGADVTVVDPHVEEWQWTHTPMLAYDELHTSLDTFAVSVLVTDHAAFDYDKISSQAPLLLDCRNAVAPAPNVEAL